MMLLTLDYRLRTLTKEIEDKRIPAGSTAVVSLLMEDKNKVLLASLGDSPTKVAWRMADGSLEYEDVFKAHNIHDPAEMTR